MTILMDIRGLVSFSYLFVPYVCQSLYLNLHEEGTTKLTGLEAGMVSTVTSFSINFH